MRLSFLDSHLDVSLAPGSDITRVLDFLGGPFTVGGHGSPAPFAELRVTDSPESVLDPSRVPADRWRAGFVRRSAADFFTVPARLASDGDRDLAVCTRTGSRFALDRAARRVDAFVGPGGDLDLVEVLRGLFLMDQENRGALVLHATSALGPAGAVLVAGAKGAGKSTVLLELAEHCGMAVLSGDKTVLRVGPDGEVRAAGWPDYPHLGHGTVMKYPGLAGIAGVTEADAPAEDFSPHGKFPVDPARFRERFPSAPAGATAPVAGVLHPSIGPGATRVEPLAGGVGAHAAALAANTETGFNAEPWHRFLPDLRNERAAERERALAAVAARPAWSLTGRGDLTPGLLPVPLAAPA